MEIQVYLFTGFLDSGKTTFIRDTLTDKRFNDQEPTLLILCEDGEEAYDKSAPYMKNVTVQILDSEEEINEENLTRIAMKAQAKKVIVEYNGMWMINDFYQRMPDNWIVYQELMFADATTFLSYNANMRNLVYDKLSSCEIVIFNRCTDQTDKETLHKIVRGVSRQTEIAYEYTDGHAEYDDIEDPLPFDLSANIVKIEDRDYALWYRDTTEDMQKYDGLNVSFKALIAVGKDFPEDTFIGGRRLMNCCAEDTIYAGFVCKCDERAGLKNGDWAVLTGKIEIRFNQLYGRKGPVIFVKEAKKTNPPEEPVATFY